MTKRPTCTIRRMWLVVAAIGVALGAAAGCSADRDPATLFAPTSGVLVVDAAMIVGKPFPAVFLTETVAADVAFDVRNATVSDATMRITSPVDTARYHNVLPGVYLPTDTGFVVQPATTYRITVSLPDGRGLTSTTTTPPAFAMDRWVVLDDAGQTVARDFVKFGAGLSDSLVYVQNQLVYSQGLLEAWFAPTTQPGYQAALFSLDLGSPLLIDPDFLDDEDLADFERRNSSPPLQNDTGKIRLPWLAVWYEGRYKIYIYTLDRNWFDFARTDPTVAGFGFGGNAGDNFGNPIFHVDGGIGLFGSAAVDSVGVYFLPRP